MSIHKLNRGPGASHVPSPRVDLFISKYSLIVCMYLLICLALVSYKAEPSFRASNLVTVFLSLYATHSQMLPFAM